MADSKLSAAGFRASISDSIFEVKVLREAGILAPMRPDKALKIGGAFLRWGASPALGVTTAAIHHPHELAIVDEKGALSWERLHRRSNALADSFAQMGIGPGDGVGIMCRNHRGFVEATLAAAKLGASALYLNTMFAGPQLAEVTQPRGPEGARLRRGVRRPARRRRRLRHPDRRLVRRRGLRSDAREPDRRVATSPTTSRRPTSPNS